MIHVSAVVHFPVDLPPTEMVPATHQGKWYVKIKLLLSVESINKKMNASMKNCAHMLSWLELKLKDNPWLLLVLQLQTSEFRVKLIWLVLKISMQNEKRK